MGIALIILVLAVLVAGIVWVLIELVRDGAWEIFVVVGVVVLVCWGLITLEGALT